ncbi:cation transport protein-domain-containing protein [Epithele typhae]|uniref:cation transport protein-domain-containing protein n=1 Tax=Epithele typhae TaxID=378194 RepID=UPI0020075CD9|nr:cation transport protein-domain-containing protein [Epithele typhae]KAH9942175.1 cation transport protein-domain-containing protein [Epithele typhae]
MQSLPGRFMLIHSRLRSLRSYLFRHLNFYRVHLLFFTFTPIVFSGIIYASNGEFPVDYVDCLFNCVSAMTVCGLATVDLSGLTPFQQVLLFMQMCLGSPVVISWMMVYIRRSFFANRFQRIVEAELARRANRSAHIPVEVKIEPWWKRLIQSLAEPLHSRARSRHDTDEHESIKGRGGRQLRTDMIRRVEGAPKLVDPSGWISEGVSDNKRDSSAAPVTESTGGSTSGHNSDSVESDEKRDKLQTEPNGGEPYVLGGHPILRTHTLGKSQGGPQLGRTQTVEFASTPAAVIAERRFNTIIQNPYEEEAEMYADDARRSSSHPSMPRRTMSRPTMSRPTMSRPTISRVGSMPRTGTILTSSGAPAPPARAIHRGFGGFPMPHVLLSRLFGRAFPALERKLTRTVTIPRTRTIASERGYVPPGSRAVPYITFEATVGHNSVFRALTQEQLEELGGVEYRGLTALLWIVGTYHIGLQLFGLTIIAPYMSISRWASDFVPPALQRPVNSTWYSLFQVVSSYTNTGMSLVDTSMVPFQTAYPMIFAMILLILAGNTAFVSPLVRSWILSKIVPRKSRLAETLQFLLDHPRRCFVYLFPSHQTWFLFTVLVFLNFTDWFFFLVLDIGNPAMDSIPLGTRFAIGLLQASAVRAAGFGTVSLSVLAPAVKVLYVLMMYVSVYPVAMSVRSTNVYEEKSLGVFNDEGSLEEESFNPSGSRAAVWGRYLAMHARRQLSFDMWWLGLALFLVCIIEKDGLDDTANATWFNIFTIIFELVSAYSSVGLSLGIPTENYSFSGALRPLSKLIICAVMLRGRHRGLPVAIDRAVMLPYEFKEGFDEFGEAQDFPGPRPSRETSTNGGFPSDWRSSDYATTTDGAPDAVSRAASGQLVEKEKPAEDLNLLSASGIDRPEQSSGRGRDATPRRPRRGSVLFTSSATAGPGGSGAGAGAGTTGGSALRSTMDERTERIVHELAQRGGLMG